MPWKKRAIPRIAAALAAVLAVMAAAPPPASAESDGLWQQWAREVTDRDKIEIPFAILFSLPPMIATTPFWLAELAFDKLTADDDDE
jgi:type IV secretory pathway VirB2 component (pilin)